MSDSHRDLLLKLMDGGRAGQIKVAPVSFSQQRLWFLDRMYPGLAFYNMPAALQLDAPVDVCALERAVGAVVEQHEALRTRFAELEGRPIQVIETDPKITVRVVDLSSIPIEEAAKRARGIVQDGCERTFDLSRLPLLRMSIV